MLQTEFENLLGHKVSVEEFRAANEVYMNAAQMPKDMFVEVFNNAPLYLQVAEMAKKIQRLEKQESEWKEQRRLDGYQFAHIAHIDAVAFYENFDDKAARDSAIRLLGAKEYLRYIVKNDYKISEDDKDLIIERL